METNTAVGENCNHCQMEYDNILVWLPSPMGDAILCSPALRAIRRHFDKARISFLARNTVQQVLSPTNLCDAWIEHTNNPLAQAARLKRYYFTHAVLFKNSFASALTCFLARIPSRTGYAREGRHLFLTDKLYPPKLSPWRYKPSPMVDYYMAIAGRLGCDTSDRTIELNESPEERQKLAMKMPEVFDSTHPLVILVCGGAFGPSKCWPSERFAQAADYLIENYGAAVVISVSPDDAEKAIADQICRASSHKLISLAENNLSLGELKSLFAVSSLVITNDTGPRHIAIAMKRKVITLFGPNDPAWTETGYEQEIKIVGEAPCAPCLKPVCKKEKHFCMESITVSSVCRAADKLLETRNCQKS